MRALVKAMLERMKTYAFHILTLFFGFVSHATGGKFWIGLGYFVRRAYWKSRLGYQGSKTAVSRKVVIHQPHMVTFGDRCTVAEFVHIWGGGEVVVGNNVLIASHVAITSMSHDTKAQIFRETIVKKPVVIEDNVWIGTGASILPGVRLGSGCIVGAGAVVTKDVPNNWIVAGVPARKIRNRFSPENEV
jgi:maltose O-acetyltransferase